jgi:hypothetical protein
MGRMKELFIEQMNKQIEDHMSIDADYQYQQYLNDKAIAELNASMEPRYSDGDIKYALESVLGDANPIVEDIVKELTELHNLRHGYTN